jgi:hypothetical protein
MHWLFISIFYLLILGLAQETSVFVEQLDLDPNVILPPNSEQLTGGFCDDFVQRSKQMFEQNAPKESSLKLSGVGCYRLLSERLPEEVISELNASFFAAGYILAQQSPMLLDMEQFAQEVKQTWLKNGFILSLNYVYAQDKGLVAFVLMMEDETFEALDTYSFFLPFIPFYPSVELPRETVGLEGGSCETQTQRAARLIKNNSGPILDSARSVCYFVYDTEWKVLAKEMMVSLEKSDYERQDEYVFENEDMIYQVWSEKGSDDFLTIVFANSKTGKGLFIIVIF